VAGRDFGLRVLQPASGLDAKRLLVLLEEAEAARMVGAVPGELSRWRFAHALLRQTLAEEVSLGRRLQLHLEIARALDAAGADTAAVAHHHCEAAVIGDAGRAADLEGRVAGAAVRWSRDWRTSFDDALLRRLTEWLTQ
jgi:hypothetical protein